MANKRVTLLPLYLIVWSLSNIQCQEGETRTVSFYGGYYSETIPSNEGESVSLELNFRTTQSSGILTILTLDSVEHYVAVSLTTEGKMEVFLRQNSEISLLGSSIADENSRASFNWQAFEINLINNTLITRLKNFIFLNYTFMTAVKVQGVYFGGPRTFFASIYMMFPSPHYYVGCVANISLNTRHIIPSGFGIDKGCCIPPRSPMWCTHPSSSSHITLTYPHMYTSDDNQTVSFHLHPRSPDDDNGGLVIANSLSTWGLFLIQGQLQLIANISGTLERVTCPGGGGGVFSALNGWREVEVVVTATTLSCGVDGIIEFTTIPSIETHVYSSSLTLQFGGTPLNNIGTPQEIAGKTFFGCFQKLRFNGIDIDVSLLVDGDQNESISHFPAVDWSDVIYNVSQLVVHDRVEERLSTDNILLQFSSDSTSLYQHEIENSIHFEVLNGPRNGRLFLGQRTMEIESFDYGNILSDDPTQQVGYFYNGKDNFTDEIEFRVWAGCDDELFHLKLDILIEDNGPRISQSRTLHLAVGTRRIITPDILTVDYPAISNHSLIQFRVQFITVQSANCSSCRGSECDECQIEEGGRIYKNGGSIIFFNQDEINRGLVSFQHFEKFSTAPMIIKLGVTVGGNRLDAFILVSLRHGNLTLTSNPDSCLFVKEEGVALLGPKQINAITDFEEQNPIIEYDLLTLPIYGVLQHYESIISEWVDISLSNDLPMSFSSPLTAFTQADINASHVRYYQSKLYSYNSIDTFQFKLHSNDFSGPAGHLCINILPYIVLLQPSLLVEVKPLVVPEGGSASITEDVLTTVLDDVQYLDNEIDLDIDQLGVVYTLVEPPSYGSLELRGHILVAGDNFTYSDITSSSLLYRHDGSEYHLDHFIFYAESTSTTYLPIKAPNLTSNLTLTIDITPDNDHAPELVALEDIRPPEGCWIPVTASNINITDMDKPKVPLQIYLRKPRKPSEIPNGIFAFRRDPSRSIYSFLMQDIHNNSVIFVHQNLTASLHYTQVIRIYDGVTYVRKPIQIEAVPLILNVSAHPIQLNSTCIHSLDANSNSPQFHFNSSMFSVSLCDHFGNNANLVPVINVSITKAPVHGHIYKTIQDELPVSQFHLHDMNKILYVLNEDSKNESRDYLELEFSYGHSIPLYYEVEICIQPVLLPLIFSTSPVVLMQGSIEQITVDHLMVFSSREDRKDSLLFHVLGGPQQGVLINQFSVEDDGMHSLSNFTYAELRRGEIMYEQHANSTSTEDSILLDVCSRFICLDQQLLEISIHPVSLRVYHEVIRVKEGGIHNFTTTDFNIQSPPGYDHITIVISSSDPPQHGNINIRILEIVRGTYFSLDDIRRGVVFYCHDSSEFLHDSFGASVIARNQMDEVHRVQFRMRIEIEPVNDHDPEIENGKQILTVVEGGSSLITTSLLRAHDFDVGSDDEDLMWSIPEFLPLTGYLYLDSDENSGLATHLWTERDIRDNRLYYKNTDTIHDVDFLVTTVSDGERSAKTSLHIHIVVVDFKVYPDLVDYVLNEGESKRITHQYLRYFAENDDSLDDNDFVITILNTTQHGVITLDGRELVMGDSFTQEEITTRQLVYTHDNSNDFSDRFELNVTVPIRKNSSKKYFFDINVVGIDDDPPVALINNPLLMMELESVEIDDRVIHIEDINSQGVRDDDKIVCQLVQPLTHGRLEKQRFQLHIDHTENFTKLDLESGRPSVWYRHLSSPNLHPEVMIFNLTDGINHQVENYSLTIIILPRVVDLKLGRLIVTEGHGVLITSEEISVTHSYLSTVRGTIHFVEGSGPHHGAFVNIFTNETVRTFTTESMANNSIIYFHNDDESLVDSFRFEYVAHDPKEFNRMSQVKTFYIDITPVNNKRPVIINNMTSLRLWATSTVLINEEVLNVTDNDIPANVLNFTIHISELEGYMAYASDDKRMIHWFTQSDIRARQVKFVHVSGPRGVMAYNVTDGLYIESGTVTIIADQLSLECDVDRWKAIEVDFLGKVNVTAENIDCTTTDDDTNQREISYIISTSQLGHFEVNSQTSSEFNSGDVNAGLVTYVHSETGYWRESETIFISAYSYPASPEYDLPLVIDVRYPLPTTDLAVNENLIVSEGRRQCLNQFILDGRNLRYKMWEGLNSSIISPTELNIIYEVLTQANHGNLTLHENPALNFTQDDLSTGDAVCYSHDDSESISDQVLLNVTIVLPDGLVLGRWYQVTLSIEILSLNDQKPYLTTSLEKTLVENFTYTLSSEDLRVGDGDSTPSEIQFLVVSIPNNTHFLHNGSLLGTNSTFTQEDIDLQYITLEPFHVGIGRLAFLFHDGSLGTEDSYEFTLTVEEHTLSLLHSRPISYFQNEVQGTVITRDHLNTSTNSFRSQTIFSLKVHPSYGRIVVGHGGESFSQEEIDHLLVKYVPYKGAQQHRDCFSLSIANKDIVLPDVKMTVIVEALGKSNDDKSINFNQNHDELVQTLPQDILLLDELEKEINRPPRIEVLVPPTFGHLEKHVSFPDFTTTAKRSTLGISSFRYDELLLGWIVYVWDYTETLANLTVVESFTVLVLAEEFQPGEIVIKLTISPPHNNLTFPTTAHPVITTLSSEIRNTIMTQTSNAINESGFPVYTLVPIIGIILFLIVLIAVVIIFCLTQQKRIKRKWAPNILHPRHQSPWSASPSLPPQVMHYELDPSGIPVTEDNSHHSSETSSGFSEPDISPRQTPIRGYAYSSTSQIHRDIPPRSRMRSNVSITFSSRQSTASEMSLEVDTSPHSYSLPRHPVHRAAEPVRPASHTAFITPRSTIVTDSGINSTLSSIPKLYNTKEVVSEEVHEKNDHHTEESLLKWAGSEELPDLNDPINIQKLFPAHNPVLEKEEYWV